ncbi:amino acid kinase family protein [Thermogemmatispora tikiterensis]|uniref:Aspartate/glutamate/uridylate kinase domain-containing protein n=1 Tax=Thermogemmatispora tikiterensis TaxID=1825093 RepID=A0A328VNA2_9CHLR|nr:hypothetical protein [Thermogemmatispora tikiterensis]RAQ95615.1 hypothetical protein A4R35_08725 [Thermogemmatispora tikiterensis]
MSKLAVVAIGGNSLIEDEGDRDGPGQLEAICASAKYVVDLVVNGWNVVIAHDNTPQLNQPDEPLPHGSLRSSQWSPASFLAGLQGRLGYLIQQALDHELQHRGLNRRSACLLTRLIVSPEDDETTLAQPVRWPPAEAQTTEEAEACTTGLASNKGETRTRLEPRELVEQEAIKTLLQAGFIVIAAAGGSIPVVRDGEGGLCPVEARLHSDLVASFLATQLNADLFLIATTAERVVLFPQQTGGAYPLDMLTLAELRQYEADGHFSNARQQSQIRAVIRYLERGGGAALLTCPQAIGRALAGRTGTWVLP